MAKDLTGRKVAITGGARGIGRATAAAFQSAGALVAIGDIDTELVTKTAAELSANRPDVVGLPLDVADRESFRRFLDAATAALGGLDVLVNNAGIMSTGSFLDEPDSSTDRQLDINVRGVLTGSKLAGRRFLAQGGGHLVNVASVAGMAGTPGVATYCAAKHAVVGLGSALHQELGPHGVTVSTICPGFVRTELIAGLSPGRIIQRVGLVDPEVIADAIVELVAVGKGGNRVVPRSAGVILRSLLPLPENARNRISRLLGTQQVMLDPDQALRAEYQRRIDP